MNTTPLTSVLAPPAASNVHSAALNAINKPLAANAPVANQTVYLRLGDIGIDSQQPRRWMCADLRAKVAAGQSTHAEAMLVLLTRASRNDLEAIGYVNTIRLLADDIAEIGMHTPVRVRLTPGGSPTRYTLVHGERRLWVCLYLAATQNLTPQATLATTIEAIVDAEAGDMSPEEIRRLQWSENLQREDVPLIDFACEVGQVYEAMYAHADLKRHEALADLGWQDDEQATSQVALALAEIEIKTRHRPAPSKAARFCCIPASPKRLARPQKRWH
ncbi:MAG: ParB N-terminal domain-containing protein, partial [Anaerolineae bacterium]|nr:ParB N-terminal domain-containing protein [Anaerolineae bacterium]